MSLPFGGKFDCFVDWRHSHCEHRIVRNADIGVSVYQNNSMDPVALNPTQRNQLINLIAAQTYNDPEDEGNHLHIEVNN